MPFSSDLSQKPFYLISSSPRRKELLNRIGIQPVVLPVDCDEFLDPQLSPEDLTLSLARQKMEVFLSPEPEAKKKGMPGDLIALSADTLVHINGRHLGKPLSREEAKEMLGILSGKIHRVTTAFVLILGNVRHEKVLSTEVAFHDLKEEDMEFYLNTSEWKDAAGAYKIQEAGEIMINWIKGSWSNVMGLPISSIYAILRDNNFWGSL